MRMCCVNELVQGDLAVQALLSVSEIIMQAGLLQRDLLLELILRRPATTMPGTESACRHAVQTTECREALQYRPTCWHAS